MLPTEVADQRDDLFILDVREDEEWEAGRIDGAAHIPMGQLNARIAEIPQDTSIVCVCRSGGRSGAVTDALNRAGFQAANMVGGMHAWEHADLTIVNDDGESGRVA